ncbi:glycosyltransferase [Gordonia alkanivorans]|uniref:Putative glycosyltransferase n=1 Tax=Gordonia alkanivorans NBRC 16433 TaxID=1027371 RepID=F9VVC0_9ACTN|nr:glycosyltransferase [Gordonia alkanivorans]GAA12559.1 putative glycosyltransferase [Gordonia alkanivorans NBRC 16433]
MSTPSPSGSIRPPIILPPNGVLAHEWIEQYGGSEQVLAEFAELAPDADILCLWNSAQGRFKEARVRESWLARTPLRRSKVASLPFMPMTWRIWRNKGYDWALISSHAFAHHFRTPGMSFERIFVYVHSPARYLWAPEIDSRGHGFARTIASSGLRAIDRHAARHPRTLAANSEYVAQRIARSWDRTSRVIHPPVDVERLSTVDDWAELLTENERTVLDKLPRPFLLAASRLVPYKAIDQTIRVGKKMGIPVVVAGAGPDRDRLESLAEELGSHVTFLGRVSDEMLYALYQEALVYVFLAVEDFGIMPVEAMAVGGRVVANSIGGTAETVEGIGQVAPAKDIEAVAEAVERVAAKPRPNSLSLEKRFGRARFRSEIAEWIEDVL